MDLPAAVDRRKSQFAIILALAATCIFGKMGAVAGWAAFENPSPSAFDQLAGVWTFLSFAIPALLIVTQIQQRVIPIAAAVHLVATLILLGVEYPHIVPVGSNIPDAQTLKFLRAEIVETVTIAIAVTALLQLIYRRILDC